MRLLGFQPGDLAEVWAIEEDLAGTPGAATRPRVADVEGQVALLIAQLGTRWLCLVNDQLILINPAALLVVERGRTDLLTVAEVVCE